MKEKHPTREQEEKKKRNDQSPNKRPHSTREQEKKKERTEVETKDHT